MSYLKHKPGSIEEMMANQAKKLNDNAYQDMFKKELEKAGRGIGAMSPKEKKDFFNKIDDKYKAKNEDTKKEAVDNPYAVGMAAAMKAKDDKPPLKKSTITKAHNIAKSIKKDEKNEDLKESTDINFMKGDGAEVSYLKRHGSFIGGGKYYKFRGVNINFFVYYNEKNKNYVEQLKLTSGNRPSNDREYDKMYDVLKKLGNERRLGKLDDSDVDIYFEGVNEEAKYPHKMYSKDGKEVEAKTPEDHKKYADMGYTHKNETHTFMTKDMNKSKKDAKGEKEIVDPAPKMKFKEAYKKAKKEAMNTVGDATADQVNQRVGEGPKENDPDIKKPKAKADTGSKATPVDTSPEVDYKN